MNANCFILHYFQLCWMLVHIHTYTLVGLLLGFMRLDFVLFRIQTANIMFSF